MKNIFDKTVTEELINRIHQLDTNAAPKWGKMSVGQMLAHCCVTYEFIYDNTHPKPKGLKKWMLKTFVKKIVTNEKPYKKNGRTAPEFIMTSAKAFETEKERLTKFLLKTQALGGSHFDQKESHSFGKLNRNEWNNMFYKHLDHHLNQFGV
ncbi:MAG: DUF1569 domain-containing protein [Winogradskyella sp.]|uniref:DUF1569 domain-containing protein n=1 Tax=Winogradskyella sp. TaxID=1883156 RepID=UPI003858A27A